MKLKTTFHHYFCICTDVMVDLYEIIFVYTRLQCASFPEDQTHDQITHRTDG